MGGRGNRGGMSGLSGPNTIGGMAGQNCNGTPNTHTYQGRGAGGGRDGHRTMPFGRCIQSRPLQQVIPQAAMFADYSASADIRQQFADVETPQHYPEPLQTAFQAHIPGQHDATLVDRNEHFR
eukprot:2079783-Rhodomonas_salina.1